MNDLPSSALLQQSSASPKTGEELETLGKQAAARFVCGGCGSLSDAVVETVKQAGLSPEQVRRVVEFANTDAFLTEFKKEGSHKVVEFEGGPASYSEVLKDLNDGGGGTVFDSGDGDYALPPPSVEKTAMRNRERLGLEETKLAEAFGVQEQPLPYADPFREALDMKDKLAAAYETLTNQLSGLETLYWEVANELGGQVKQAALAGATLGQVVSAWDRAQEDLDPGLVKAAFAEISPHLLGSVYLTTEDFSDSLTKTASKGVLNPEHPVVTCFSDFCETLSKLASTRVAQQEVAEHLDQMSTFLKQAVPAAAVGKGLGKATRLAGKTWGKATELSGKGADILEGVAQGAGASSGVAKGVAAPVRYAPHISAGLAAEDQYQKAKYNPEIQGLKNFVLSRSPHTPQWYVRQRNLQARGAY